VAQWINVTDTESVADNGGGVPAPSGAYRQVGITCVSNAIMDEKKIPGDLYYIITNDKEMLKINKEFLNRDTLTDVIAFDYSEEEKIDGEIYISKDTVKRNANDYKVSLREEILRVMIHGALHLCGYNDKNKELQKPTNLFQNFKNLPPRISIEPDSSPASIWPVVLIGLVVGFLQGFLGVGGGFILVPVLILFLNMKTHHAVGTSLITIVISSIFAAFLYYQAGKVLVPVSLLLGLGSLAGVSFGVSATRHINGEILKHFYSIFLLLTSVGIALKTFNYQIFSMGYMLILSFGVGLIILVKYYYKNKLQPEEN